MLRAEELSLYQSSQKEIILLSIQSVLHISPLQLWLTFLRSYWYARHFKIINKDKEFIVTFQAMSQVGGIKHIGNEDMEALGLASEQ